MKLKQIDPTKTYLVTGAAGFIGYFLAKKLLELGCQVVGVDNLNNYYDPQLKQDRLKMLAPFDNFTFIKGDISDQETVAAIFENHLPHFVINLAAQAGVRYSLENPEAYIKSNVTGFFNIIEACRRHPVENLLYASSSSVYGANKKVPFEESDSVDHPVSLYAATKKANELMAHTYSHLYKIPSIGLRFFTVYGPFGRPDMAYFSFADKYFKDEAIQLFNNGDVVNDLYRDFTYIDDIVEGITRLIPNPVIYDGQAPHKIYNIGNSQPEKLMFFIETLEKCFSRSLNRSIEFQKKFEPLQQGDVAATFASTEQLENAIGFKPSTSIRKGLQFFSDWYCSYYKKT